MNMFGELFLPYWGLFAAIINNDNQNRTQTETKESINDSEELSKPWLYSVGVVDEHGLNGLNTTISNGIEMQIVETSGKNIHKN